ncbi:hypothetical protein JQN72_14025 [Phycicoccus sp. CSK15P-2]|uniref:hypothetical protein n=1 Tax=Phycicoccus sp. CSK15P-2 TaxID=2807627 RepID=UPI00194DE4A6|nr:hypothetical protein [Phycicoccus sp. CSK15P-2]MBM6405359.1 hypothetical protein [Phycicoccus sp. CSK15P-2]
MQLDISRRSVLTSGLLGAGGAVLLAPPAEAAIPKVKRSVVMDRARFWTSRNVQYDQGATYPGPAGQARYRCDCSGFVSMCLMLPPAGPNTTALAGGTYTFGIAKANLKRGDMLVRSGVHVVLFHKWANAAHTRFWLFEEASPAQDMNHRVADLSAYGGYAARRARNIVNG